VDPRSRILARRAHFIGASLSVIGCSPAQPRGDTTVALLPRDVSDAAPGPSASVPDPDSGVAPQDSGVLIDAPFKIPDGVTSETRSLVLSASTAITANYLPIVSRINAGDGALADPLFVWSADTGTGGSAVTSAATITNRPAGTPAALFQSQRQGQITSCQKFATAYD
jgi:hypothetical protein